MYSKMAAVKIFVLVTSIITTILTSNANSDVGVSEERFHRHARQQLYNVAGSSLSSKVVLSRLDCLRRCSADNQCKAVNVCDLHLGGKVKVNCTLLSTANTGLTTVADISCFAAKKEVEEVPFVPIVCQNNGTAIQNGTVCNCPPQYAGVHCERYIRDCSEPFERGIGTSYDGIYLIQPIGAPAPFYVSCLFDWGGATEVFKWSNYTDLTWSTLKRGFNLNMLPGDRWFANYFIGMDNLHYMTSQADQEINIWMNLQSGGSVSAYYRPFTVDSEANRYQMRAPGFSGQNRDGALVPNDGFAGVSPLLLSTSDNDTGSCAAKWNGAGWYGPGPACLTGYSVFSRQPKWLVGGLNTTINYVGFTLVRKSNFTSN